MANNRIFYAVHKVVIAPYNDYSSLNGDDEVNGVQSVGITTTFNLDQVFELGQVETFENIEGVPDIEVTIEKVMDGDCPVYLLATQHSGSAATTLPTLTGRSNGRCHVILGIYNDTANSAHGVPVSEVFMSGMYVSSVSYSAQTEGSVTESCTLVGNDKTWLNTPTGHSTAFIGTGCNSFENNDDTPAAVTGVQRRENVVFRYPGTGVDVNGAVSGDGTILPTDIPGVSSSGTNDKTADVFGAHITGITASVDLGRDEIFELGRKKPYFRYVAFPVEVTTEITTYASSGDLVNANSDQDNLSNRSIRIECSDGLRVNLGKKNKLQTVSYTGGDAGGDNVELTYTYTNFNAFTVTHSGDPLSLTDTY